MITNVLDFCTILIRLHLRVGVYISPLSQLKKDYISKQKNNEQNSYMDDL